MKTGIVDRPEVNCGWSKKAVIREQGYPIGQPAPMYLICVCGKKNSVENYPDGPDIACTCGVQFNNRGWIKA